MIKEIRPLEHLDAVISIPGSKSYTQRALVIASLADGPSVLRHPLISEDTCHLIDALRSLGAGIIVDTDEIRIKGTGGRLRCPPHPISLGNNGTALRLLTTMVALGQGIFTLTGDQRLCERPVKPLLDALRNMGVDAGSSDRHGFPPVVIRADGIGGGRVVLQDIESSQYVSSLLISSPYARHDMEIDLAGRIPSLPYVKMTVEAMRNFGQTVMEAPPHRYIVRHGRPYEGRIYAVEGDVSSASYFFLAAALTKGRVRVENINPRSLQGDLGLVSLMEGLGCSVVRGERWIELTGGNLTAGDRRFNLNDMPDMVPTLAVLSALRSGRTIITDVAHLRHKESNRLSAMVTELLRIGITARETDDGITIEGGTPHGADIETYNDHRIAMSFAALGLVVPGMRIRNPACVHKSFPVFWEMLDRLYP